MASAISGFINTIRNAVYGEQVRGAIVSALEACYSDVNNPSLQTEAFETALNEAYAGGILDIQERSTIAGMTNTKIIYRYTGNEEGYTHNGLYYYNGTEWEEIGSSVRVTTDFTDLGAGKAADAAAVGQLIGVSSGSFNINDPTLWERKTIIDGIPQDSTTTIKLIGYLPAGVTKITADTPYGILPFRYAQNGEWVGYLTATGYAKTGPSNWQRSYTFPNDEYQYRVLVKNIDNQGAATTTEAAQYLTVETTERRGGIYGMLDTLDEKLNAAINGGGYWTDRKVSADEFVQGEGVSLDFSDFGNDRKNMSSIVARSPYIDIVGAKLIKFTAIRTSDTTAVMYGTVLYDKDKQPIKGRGISTYYNRQQGDSLTDIQYLFIPENAAYMRTTYWAAEKIESDNLDEFTYSSIPIPDDWKPFTNELPLNPAMLNMIKRARQMSDIEWTPFVDISRYCLMDGNWQDPNAIYGHFLDWFKSGRKYKGIPYSGGGTSDVPITSPSSSYLAGRWGYNHMFVGLNIDFETFVTAARYPNSIMGETTEQTTPGFDSSPYGIYCSSLVHYALGGYEKIPYPSTGYFRPGGESFGLLSNFGYNNLRIGDVFSTSGHVAIVTDTYKNENGDIYSVEVTEATTIGNGNNSVDNGASELGGIARRKAFDIDALVARFGG